MAKLQYKGTVTSRKGKAEYVMPIFTFTDDGCKIVYAPALDLTGYGKTESQARESFDQALEAFTEYAMNKGTLVKELKRLGWKIKTSTKKLKSVSSPDLADMLRSNDYLADVFQTKNFKKHNTSVALPV